MTSENLDLLIKILSAGVIAAFVTGFFSVITSIKTNKRLKEIELIKQKYDMEKQKCDQLETHLKELVQKEFPYQGGINSKDELVKRVAISCVNTYGYIRKEHESHSFLFKDSENKEIQEYENTIDYYINRYIAESMVGARDADKLGEYLNKIMELTKVYKENYYLLIRRKIKEILDK